jgi:plastocyanin
MYRSACVAALFAAGALAGCGSSSTSNAAGAGSTSTGSKTSGAGGSFTVSESEFKITPKHDSVAATGTITITAHNNGKIIHALAVQTPSGVVRTAAIQPGSSASLTVNLTKAGSYTLFCPIDHHRQLGMVATIKVAGGGGGAAATSGGAASTTTSSSGGAGYGSGY